MWTRHLCRIATPARLVSGGQDDVLDKLGKISTFFSSVVIKAGAGPGAGG